MGQIFGPLIIVLFLLFGGQLINLDSLSVVLRWIQYISLIGYSNKALAQNEFYGLALDPCLPNAGACYSSGEQVLKVFSYDTVRMFNSLANNV